MSSDAVSRATRRLESSTSQVLNAIVAYDRSTVEAQSVTAAMTDASSSLHGVSVGVKDNICTLEYATTCASKMLQGYCSPFEATAIRRLKAAGALITCKTNMDEFGMGSSTEHSVFGRCHHPEDPKLVPGGSSGGSAAAVAAGLVDVALGSETGGSVRQPASFCGVVGFKPTYGRISRYGLVAFGSSLDQIGVFGRTVPEVTSIVSTVSGRDAADSTTLALNPILPLNEETPLAGLRVGVINEWMDDADVPVRQVCNEAVALLQANGASVSRVTVPNTALHVPTYYVVAPAEASANLARFDGVRYGGRTSTAVDTVHEVYRQTRGEGFGPEVKRRILLGTYLLSAGYRRSVYRRAQRARRLISEDFSTLFEQVDVLFSPTTPTTAFVAGTRTDPVSMYLEDRFTVAANLAGLPAISIPVGRSNGLPVGGQLMANRCQDERLLNVAAAFAALIDGGARP